MKPEENELVYRLYQEMYDMLVSYAKSALHDEYLAEELTQEVFVTAVCKPEELMNSPNPQGWLYKTMWNTIQNYNRTSANRLKLIADYLAVNGAEITMSIDQPDLRLKYGRLAQTEEFRLIYDIVIEGKTYEELARERGISVENCRKRAERAKRYLRRKIKK